MSEAARPASRTSSLPRWRDPAWRAEADGRWVDARLAAGGRARPAPATPSGCVAVVGGLAGADRRRAGLVQGEHAAASRHEARALPGPGPPVRRATCSTPLALDVERGCLLLPDGGPTLREARGRAHRRRRRGSGCSRSTPPCSAVSSPASTSCVATGADRSPGPTQLPGDARRPARRRRAAAARRRGRAHRGAAGRAASPSSAAYAAAVRRAGGVRHPALAAARRPARQQRVRAGRAGRAAAGLRLGRRCGRRTRSACC